MDKEDQLLREYLKSKRESQSLDSKAPSVEQYYRYLTGETNESETLWMEQYLVAHKEAQNLILHARELLEKRENSDKSRVPSELLNSVKKPSKASKSASWAVFYYSLSGISFILSFLVHRYYMQFLVLALLFGLKAILDQRAHRTQVLVYKALQNQGEVKNSQREKNRRF